MLRRRWNDNRFLFAVPDCLWPGARWDAEGNVTAAWPGLPGFAEGQIDHFLGRYNIWMEAYERDRVTDDLARKADLFPLIAELQHWPLCLIGPEPLDGMKQHLAPDWEWRFVPISTPNLHKEEGGIERTVELASAGRVPGIYLVSAGVSAAIIIDRLHDAIPDSWFLDCGSIWDAFVGIGGQREWRAKLYADPVAWEQWKRDNLEGKDGRGW